MWLHQEIKNVADIARHHARTSPQHTALIDPAGRRSFADLERSSNGIASSLRAHGIAAGAHIGFLGKNSCRYFELLFGAAKAGCSIVPLNWRLAEAELRAVIIDAQCPVVFVDREFAELLDRVRASCVQAFQIVSFDSSSAAAGELEAWVLAGDGRDPHVPIHPDDTAILIYTSGTTGQPKGVQLTHGGLGYMRLCEHLEPALKQDASDVLLTAMPLFHLVGTGLSLQALYNGATVSLLPVMEPGALLKLLARDRPTICALVPTAIQMLLDHPDASRADFSSLRLVMYAGSPISSALLKRALLEMRCSFMQFYGATESSGALTLLRPEQHDVHNEARLRACGTPLPLIDIEVRDSEGRPLPDGQTGEFWVRAPSLFGGYWQQPEATAAVLQDGWYRSGDAGYRDHDGLYYIVDRVKDMIVTGGENVYSAEVEQALCRHPAVRQCAVIGLPDEKWGERVTAVIIARDGQQPRVEDIIAHCREYIAGYKVPKEVRFVGSMPMTATGKVLKRALREELLRQSAPQARAIVA
ncbi:AMP-binding enzyme C-terminal domain-containing protein [Solimonas aquatica]|uniref:AMP-binding enzyme C-terminal domain-containing protein n=1 Tax=Solimonas aquatica TaxID=489703 RepID=A0A1H9BE55_9GAMM|nr:long-chain-fatty-acid--CoA ligase [Solimonas aquatica]SEP87234.1 AMP-binding enzyme C-terminal domain-containing protein [Solimonas aquatica]